MNLRRPEEANLLRQPFQRVHSSVLEPQIGACHQIAHRARNKHTTGFSKIHNARGGVDGDPSDIIALQLDLARVHPCANLQPEPRGGAGDRRRATNGPSGTVECRQEAVAECLDLPPTEMRKLLSNETIMALQ